MGQKLDIRHRALSRHLPLPQRYEFVQRPISVALVAESRRLGAYPVGMGERTGDIASFMRANGGVEPSTVDGGLFFRLLAEVGLGDRSNATARYARSAAIPP